MTREDALIIIDRHYARADERMRKRLRRLSETIHRSDRMYKWMEYEVRYLGPVRASFGSHGSCCGGVMAEALYNGGGTEDDISFNIAVKIYEGGF